MLGDGVTVEALWSVRSTKAAVVRTGHSLVREQAAGTDYTALAAAGSRVLDGVAREIAATLRAMSHGWDERLTGALTKSCYTVSELYFSEHCRGIRNVPKSHQAAMPGKSAAPVWNRCSA